MEGTGFHNSSLFNFVKLIILYQFLYLPYNLIHILFNITFAGDNLVDKQEYTKVYTSYGLCKDECEQAFDKFATVSIIILKHNL